MNRQKTLNQVLKNVLDTLVTRYRPEKVILFGSMAEGRTGEWSDLDLVIIKETSQPFVARSEEVALLCMAPVGVDYLVYTPDEFEQMISEQNAFVLEEVLQKGKVLYERQPTSAMATESR
ncbi:MAG: nucleotidyltransferase domain-containing protein [Anaerolineales bacterium]|nr:nucleotidyltransferase domain-containing protein [Anaerolineales bacterium]